MFSILDDYKDKIKTLYSLYFENRKLYIIAEELTVNMNLYPAPLIEHRDAFDHLMRCFEKIEKQDESFAQEIESAFNHELRAYYDIADYICIHIREYIATVLNKMSIRDIRKIWAEYEQKKREVFDISMEIARIRNERRSSYENILRYRDEVMPRLIHIYEEFIKKIETRIRGRF